MQDGVRLYPYQKHKKIILGYYNHNQLTDRLEILKNLTHIFRKQTWNFFF